MTDIHQALSRLAEGEALSQEDTRDVTTTVLAGEATPAQTAAFLMALRVRGETEAELLGLVEGMRSVALSITPQREPLVDLCGTGGDGSGTFNISTAAALVVAAAGVGVAKHGNRAASSRCGSADVLEALGIPVDLPPDRAKSAIEEVGFAFLFAPLYHPAMKYVGPVRREMRIRTVFNVMGPLASPAGVKRQVIGVFDGGVRARLARTLQKLGGECVWVVHGAGGLDELSLSGPSQVSIATPESIEETTVEPADAGLATADLDALQGGDAKQNATIIGAILAGQSGPPRDSVLLNAAAALVVAGATANLREGAERAAQAIDRGDAARLLDQLRSFA